MIINNYHLIPKNEASLHKMVGCDCNPHKPTKEGASELVIHRYFNGDRRNEKVQENYTIWKLVKVK